MQLQDHRVLPFSTVMHEDLDAIAEGFVGRDVPLARSVYMAILQLVSETPGTHTQITRKDLAVAAGVSVRKLDELMIALEEHALVHVVRQREGRLSLPNQYGLGDGGTCILCASAGHDTEQSCSSSLPLGKDEVGVEGSGEARVKMPEDLGAELAQDVVSLSERKYRVGGRVVQLDEMITAAMAIQAFNAHSGSSFGLAAHLTPIVGRIRERPSWDYQAHMRLIESAFRLKWWEGNGRRRKGRVTPAVVYGNERVFEAVIQDAIDEKAGNTPTATKRRLVKKSAPSADDL